VAQAGQQGVHGHDAARRADFPRRVTGGADAPGRKTGKPRSTPVTPMDVDGKRYVVNGYPGADWVDNVRAAGEVTLTQGRRSERVRMVELAPEDARPVLRAFPAAVPTGADLMKRVGLLTEGTPEEAEGLAGRCPVFLIEPVT